MAAPYQGPTETGLMPDRDCAWAFLSWWFKRCTLGLVEIGWMNPVTGGLTAFQRFALEDESILDAIVAINSVPGQSIYVRACTIAPDTPAGKTTDLYIMQAPGGWGDLDTLAQVAHASLVAADAGVLIRPCGWVRTGRIPHDRFQLYLLASEPLVSGPLIRQVNRQFHALYGGDPAVVNPSRLMRMPGTIAWPYKPGREPEMTSFGVFTDRPGAYPASTITAMLPQVNGEDHSPTALPHAGNGAAGAGGAGEWDAGQPATTLVGGISRESQLIGQITQGNGNWHNSVITLVGLWINQGMSDAAIRLAAHTFRREPYTLSQTLREVQTAVDGGRRKWGIPEPAAAAVVEAPPTEFPATPLNWDRMMAVPPRQWVYGHFLIRRFVSILGAPGGTGKTAYAYVIACCLLTGIEILRETVHEPGNIWLYNLEDPMEELERRFKAVVLHHNLDRHEIQDRLFLDSGRDRPLTVAVLDKHGNAIATPIPELIVAEIIRRKVKVMIVDPFIRSHSLEENDNVQIDLAINQWAMVADKADCAILLLHHFRKGGTSGDAGAFRGASSLIDAARSAISLAPMTAEEADRLGIPDRTRWQFIRVDNAKLNLAPPPEDTTWLRLVNVPLENAAGGRIEDHVQTVERWEPESPWEGIPMSVVIRILDAIEAGPGNGEQFTTRANSADKSRWAGSLIVQIAGKTEGQARGIIRAWVESGTVLEGRYRSPGQRKDVAGCTVDPAKLAEMRHAVAPDIRSSND